jgi:alpha-L-rhamnosidase
MSSKQVLTLLTLIALLLVASPVVNAANPEAADAGNNAAVAVAGLRCECRTEPFGIDVMQPRFGWRMESTRRGQKQTAYRIIVGDVWDSGKVNSDQSVAVTYAGKELQSGQRYSWKVMVWDKDGQALPWSTPATFVTGKLHPTDWHGKWIGASQNTNHAAVYLRREIEIEKPVTQATVFFSGLGFSELAIDGRKVGNYVIGPGFTTYDKRVQYLAFDVTDRFASPGRKTLDVTLADGWYGLERDPWVHQFEKRVYVDKPKLLFDLHLRHADGTETVICSDDSWKWSDGEITRSWIAQEDIDRRKSGRNWQPVSLVAAPAGKLVSQREPFNRIVNETNAASMKFDAAKKAWVWDFAQEISGWVRLRAAGPAGTEIKITTIPSQPLPRTSRFVLAGDGRKEVYEPRFFYSGMQRVEVTGLVSKPELNDLVCCQVSSMYTPSGSFHCSDELQNWLDDCVRRTVVSYTTFLPNDPVREWKGWVQDMETMFPSAVYLFDSQTMYERWQHDLLDGQNADGNCPNVAPGPFYDDYNSPWWGGCVVWMPWHWYRYYGDESLLRESYPAMKRYVDYLSSVARDGQQDWGLADWFPVEETPREIINTPAHFLYAQIVSRTAEMLGHREDARRYADIAEKLRIAFNRKFLDPATGIYGAPGWKPQIGNWEVPVPIERLHEVWWAGDRPCTQAGQVLPLALGMVPPESRAAVEKALLREIAAHRDHVSTGFVSTPYLLRILADLAPEVGWKITSARDFPSWHSMTRGSGHDLMKETWDGSLALMPSLGGSIAAWHNEAIAGIRPAAPGFKQILIKPAVVGNLTWVKALHDSPYGRIVSDWKREGDKLTMDVAIPANTTATVYVPATDLAAVSESGKPVAQALGVKYLRAEGGRVVLSLESGSYHFETRLPRSETPR